MIRTQFNPDYKGCKGLYTDETTTHTVPDQTMSIRTLLDRHSRGLPLGAQIRQGEYFDTEVPHFDDLTDALKHKKNLVTREKNLLKQLQEEKQKELKIQKQSSAKAEPTPDKKSE